MRLWEHLRQWWVGVPKCDHTFNPWRTIESNRWYDDYGMEYVTLFQSRLCTKCGYRHVIKQRIG